jgi:hypothetical protein
MKSLRASDLDAVLLASPKGIPIQPQTSQANEMTINTIIDPRFRSPVKIHNRIWFNPADASALGRIRLRRGEDDFKKIYRFAEQGVFRYRIEPKDTSEARLEPEKWTDIKESFYHHDLSRLECTAVTDRALLVYILSAGGVSNHNKSLSLCVFGKRQLHRVLLRAQGLKPLEVSYLEKKPQTETRKQTQIQALKIALTSEPMGPNSNETENFSFLGFHKDIVIYIDPVACIPIQISGVIPSIGKAELKLIRINLNQASY